MKKSSKEIRKMNAPYWKEIHNEVRAKLWSSHGLSNETIEYFNSIDGEFSLLLRANVLARKSNGSWVTCFARHKRHKNVWVCNQTWAYNDKSDKFIHISVLNDYLERLSARKKFIYESFIKSKLSKNKAKIDEAKWQMELWQSDVDSHQV